MSHESVSFSVGETVCRVPTLHYSWKLQRTPHLYLVKTRFHMRIIQEGYDYQSRTKKMTTTSLSTIPERLNVFFFFSKALVRYIGACLFIFGGYVVNQSRNRFFGIDMNRWEIVKIVLFTSSNDIPPLQEIIFSKSLINVTDVYNYRSISLINKTNKLRRHHRYYKMNIVSLKAAIMWANYG